MSVTSWKNPLEVNEIEGMCSAWLNESNVLTPNDTYTYVNVVKDGSSCNLQVFTFDFDVNDIPTDSVIDGLEVEIQRYAATANDIVDGSIRLIIDGDPAGDDNASASTWPTTEGTVVYGGAADKWGLGLTEDNVKDISFGVQLNVDNDDSDNSVMAYVDSIRIRIYYTEGAPVGLDETEWKEPSTVETNTGICTAWSDPENAQTDNATYATSAVLKNDISCYLNCYDYGFTTSDIPEGSIIQGVLVEVQRKSSAQYSLYDNNIRLLIAGSPDGTNKASGIFWPVAEDSREYGGEASLWELSLDEYDIRDADFGARVQAYNYDNSTRTASVDVVRVKVFFTPSYSSSSSSRSSSSSSSSTPLPYVDTDLWYVEFSSSSSSSSSQSSSSSSSSRSSSSSSSKSSSSSSSSRSSSSSSLSSSSSSSSSRSSSSSSSKSSSSSSSSRSSSSSSSSWSSSSSSSSRSSSSSSRSSSSSSSSSRSSSSSSSSSRSSSSSSSSSRSSSSSSYSSASCQGDCSGCGMDELQITFSNMTGTCVSPCSELNKTVRVPLLSGCFWYTTSDSTIIIYCQASLGRWELYLNHNSEDCAQWNASLAEYPTCPPLGSEPWTFDSANSDCDSGDVLVELFSSSSSSFSGSSSSSSSCSQDPDKDYSKGDYASLPANDSNLETDYICTEYPFVAIDDNEFVGQTATDEFAIQQFKNKFDVDSMAIVVEWKGKMGLTTSGSTAYLQIYNYDSPGWETLDTDTTTVSGTEFILSGTQSEDVTNYYDGSNWVTCRVYQEAGG